MQYILKINRRSLAGTLLWMLIFIGSGCYGDHSNSKNIATEEAAENVAVEKIIGPAGGTVEVSNAASPIFGTRINIPENALTEDTHITISGVNLPQPLPESYEPIGECIYFGPHGTIFQTPVELVFPFTDTDGDSRIDGINIPEEDLVVLNFNEDDERWNPIVVYDHTDYGVSIKTTHFSFYIPAKYIERACDDENPQPLTTGEIRFVLHHNRNEVIGAVTAQLVDMAGNNITLVDENSATIDATGYPSLFKRIQDATKWEWTSEIEETLTDITAGVRLEDDAIRVDVTPTQADVITFTWNFDYTQMLSGDRLVVHFSGTADCGSF